MLDRDLAALYGVDTGNLNKAVSRNRNRFPSDFMFQLTPKEAMALRFQFGSLKRGEHFKYLPFCFTENGVAMLSTVLRSERAIRVNIQIMRTFTKLREALSAHRDLAGSDCRAASMVETLSEGRTAIDKAIESGNLGQASKEIDALFNLKNLARGGRGTDSSGELAALKKAVASAQIPTMTDYGRNFWIKSHPAGATPETILQEVVDSQDGSNVLDYFKISSGNKAVRQLAGEWRSEAQQEIENQEPANAKIYRDVASEMENAFLDTTRFQSVRVAFHDVAEDGDTEYKVVLAQKQDGSWLTLNYSNFPF